MLQVKIFIVVISRDAKVQRLVETKKIYKSTTTLEKGTRKILPSL